MSKEHTSPLVTSLSPELPKNRLLPMSQLLAACFIYGCVYLVEGRIRTYDLLIRRQTPHLLIEKREMTPYFWPKMGQNLKFPTFKSLISHHLH